MSVPFRQLWQRLQGIELMPTLAAGINHVYSKPTAIISIKHGRQYRYSRIPVQPLSLQVWGSIPPHYIQSLGPHNVCTLWHFIGVSTPPPPLPPPILGSRHQWHMYCTFKESLSLKGQCPTMFKLCHILFIIKHFFEATPCVMCKLKLKGTLL